MIVEKMMFQFYARGNRLHLLRADHMDSNDSLPLTAWCRKRGGVDIFSEMPVACVMILCQTVDKCSLTKVEC